MSDSPWLMPAVAIPPRDTTFAVFDAVEVRSRRLPFTIPMTDELMRLDFSRLLRGDRRR